LQQFTIREDNIISVSINVRVCQPVKILIREYQIIRSYRKPMPINYQQLPEKREVQKTAIM